MQSRGGFFMSSIGVLLFPRILLMTKHYKLCLWFRKGDEQRPVLHMGFYVLVLHGMKALVI